MVRLNTSSISSSSRLFTRFAVIGLVAFFIIAFLLFQVWMRAFEQYLIRQTKEDTARYVDALIGHMLTEEDFREIKKGPEQAKFRRKIAHVFTLPEVVRVKIYNADGVLIWSDSVELLEVSPPASDNPDLLEALKGHVAAEISRLRKDEHRFERESFRTLMELYVPIYLLEQKDKPAGVAEVYLNIDPLFVTIRNTGWLIGLTIAGGLGLLLLISFFGLGRAVGLIHKQNEELRGALDEIFKAHRMKDELVDNLRHEVRNPDAVMSYAALLLDGAFGDLPPNLRPSLERMRNTAAELLAHFTRILQLVRLKAGDVQMEPELVDLSGLLRDVRSDLALLCGNGTVGLKVDVPPGEVSIHTDKKLVHEVILNLVTNAIKCTPKGQVRLRLERNGGGGGARIVVEDTGIGIKSEDLPKIFDEFYSGKDPRMRFKSGVGLGLPIVKRSLKLLRGDIQVESTYGEGSRFTVTLPKAI